MRGSRNDPLLAAALLALNSQRKQGGGPSELVACQAFLAQIAIFSVRLKLSGLVCDGCRD